VEVAAPVDYVFVVSWCEGPAPARRPAERAALMSVFQRQREHPMPLRCRHGHALTRWSLVSCDGHKAHKVAICPMRRGPKPCGDVVYLPPLGPGCEISEE